MSGTRFKSGVSGNQAAKWKPGQSGNPAGKSKLLTPGGTLTTIHSFCAQPNCTDGGGPFEGLLQATNGSFYGTTASTIFTLSVGLGPFVTVLPESGQVGQVIRILGTDLTGASAVTFHGASAAFTIDAPTEITTTVPPGATTGIVQVTIPTFTLLSAGPFRVLP